MLGLIGNLIGMFGGSKGKSSSEESFQKKSKTDSEASSQDLSPELLKSLEGLFKGQIGNFGKGNDAVSARLQQLMEQSNQPQFDVAGFAKGITDQAASVAGLAQESGINSVLSQAGSSEGGNSMSALLSAKVRNQTAANLGGISAQATATGEGIRQAQQNSLTEGIQGLGGSLTDSILKLIAGTRGATQTGKSTVNEESSGTGKSSETSSTKKSPFSIIGDIIGGFNTSRSQA